MLKQLLTIATRPSREIVPASPDQNLAYDPKHLTRVVQGYSNGQVDLEVRVYWPGEQAPPLAVRVGQGPWLPLAIDPQAGYWQTQVKGAWPGMAVQFRYQTPQGTWLPFTPLTALERVYATNYVPDLHRRCGQTPPVYDRARVLLETTLEGLLSGYAGGRLAPRNREELFQNSIAQMLVKTDVPGILSEWAIDQIMAPITSSVADRSYLNPKFNYLTYDVADVDWQVGRHQDFAELVDHFHRHGISIVPDLIFVHQVSHCFEGSLDSLVEMGGDQSSVAGQDDRPGRRFFVDEQAYQFRDYGTWMFNLEDAAIRSQLIDKIVTLVDRYRFKMIRLDYIDGLILQYSRRKVNYGEIFLQDLRKAIKTYDPQVLILGETFAVLDNPTVKGTIDLFYTPVGFSLLEELYKPAPHRDRPLYPDLRRLAAELRYFTTWPRRNAAYAQLHDETCADEHVAASRPHVPWAYGNNPAELARRQGESLVDLNLLPQPELLAYVRYLVRNTESLTLFSANLLYMFSPAVDALTLGSSDQVGNWRVHWDRVTVEQLHAWQRLGFSESEIIYQHQRHRQEMIRLRQIFRHYSLINPQSGQPLTQVEVYHVDIQNSVVVLVRRSLVPECPSVLVVVNCGARSFQSPQIYELPLAQTEMGGSWHLIFQGDQPFPANLDGPGLGTIVPQEGAFLQDQTVLPLTFKAWDLMVLVQDMDGAKSKP